MKRNITYLTRSSKEGLGTQGDSSTLPFDLEDLLPDIDELASTSRAAIANTLRVKGFLTHIDPAMRSAAGANLSAVLGAAASPVAGVAAGPNTKTFQIGRKIEETVATHRARPETYGRRHPGLRRSWTYAGLLLSCLGIAAIALEHWWIAVVVIGGRILISMSLGRDGNLPFETGHVGDEPALRVLIRCVSSHMADAAVLLSVAWVLAANHRLLWAGLVAVTAAAMLIATLLRIAALQVGVQLYRLHLERVLRNSFLMAGLIITALAQPQIPSEGYPFIALAAAGALVYAIGEFVRTVSQIRHQQELNGGILPDVVILVTGSDRNSVALRPGWQQSGTHFGSTAAS